MSENAMSQVPDGQHSIVLPCTTEDFGSFIGSLLGKPQTITGAERGAFELRKQDILNSYHLVVQRVLQQNDAQLIQFTIKMVFDDNSSVLLNSLDDFDAYAEVRPVVPTQVHLSWAFIVKFRDKNYPEKQEIELSFLTSALGAIAIGETEDVAVVPVARLVSGGHITFRIRHTARTWGADLEGLLKGHAKHLILPQPPIREFVQKHSGKIALIIATLFFVGTVVACLATADRLAAEQLKLLSDLLNTQNAVDQKLNKILSLSVDGFWGRYFFSVFVFAIFALVAAIVLGFWSENMADTQRPSYILLTKKAEQYKEAEDKRYGIRWISFLGSVLMGIITGIVSNILFSKYWAG